VTGVVIGGGSGFETAPPRVLPTLLIVCATSDVVPFTTGASGASGPLSTGPAREGTASTVEESAVVVL
jgi:hypothetical protein